MNYNNATFNSYLPDEMTFVRGLLGGSIADGRPECNFIWENAATTRSSPLKTLCPINRFPFTENAAPANAPYYRVFAYPDEPTVLAAHMGESSMMMLGSRMSISVDAEGGRTIGSKFPCGSVMAMPLSLEEVIIERQMPVRKVWETIGTPNLNVMAHYRMGFELTPKGESSRVRVFIDCSLPAHAPEPWLGYLLSGVCAR